MPEEVELKLALGRDAAARLRRHPALRDMPGTRMTLTNTYYDTPEGALEAARVALRIRRTPQRTLQTLKTAGRGSGGLSSRGEWEWPIDGTLDLAGLADLPPMQALGAAVLAALEPRFTTDFERECWLVERGAARIEVALDRGGIRAGERHAAIDELELELKAGTPAALWQLAGEFADEVPLRPANASKAARGAMLREGHWPVADLLDGDAAVRFDRAIDALDALADSGDERLRKVAQNLFTSIADDTALDAETRALAHGLASALVSPDWLRAETGRHCLALHARLHAA